MGIIKDGKFIKDGDISQLRNRQQSTYKNHEHRRQRQDHAREIIQPYNRDGKPNPDFIQAFPEESKGYGFLPSDEKLRSL
jgi:ABC-type multidrug transport system ATPase subunit